MNGEYGYDERKASYPESSILHLDKEIETLSAAVDELEQRLGQVLRSDASDIERELLSVPSDDSYLRGRVEVLSVTTRRLRRVISRLDI